MKPPIKKITANTLLCMTDNELFRAAQTRAVLDIIESGLDNYHLFHELIALNKENDHRRIAQDYPSLFHTN